MAKSPLDDEDVVPTDAVLRGHLREAFDIWKAFESLLADDYPELVAEWGYYADVRHWFLKITKRKTTVCWVSVQSGEFKVTCYFNKRRESGVLDATMPDPLRSLFLAVDDRKRNWDISIIASRKNDMPLLRALLRLKTAPLSPL